ncbi:hypothetical protein [Sulfitobacter guttiformis]|uniref:Glycosyl transferase family 1 n=1 Tax=Sulfitobacter guttiformis TaxID=74349 RepID=A0A420DPB0_9RHOB|nr:hypothetical protein [Sulfitobacter guttiformis]KIN73327.1 hypothetical protein Z949_2516 [Sulfitobacter guttiformis KCTC 32187]RKE95997.1 hypothetical protein C8N30_0547 [Sulfitobacter guttiformis]
MAKIAFYANHLTERGTAVALFDYADQNRRLLGNESVVIYDRSFAGNNLKVIDKFKETFDLIPCDSFAEADTHIRSENCDLMYVLKAGKRDGLISKAVPTMVHSVFAATVGQVHGASYAYISEWLSNHCTQGRVPWVPHMVTIGDTDETMRAALDIPQDAIVFGCYGGRDSFDIGFVKDLVIPNALETLPKAYFVFMNIEKFIDHPRVIFMPATADMGEKTTFINTCDAMLHARRRGETFGLAVGEFSLRGKPVLTFGGSRERAHLDFLGAAAQIYHTADDLYKLIVQFDRSAPSAQEAYQRLFSPAPVMRKFEENLILPAEAGDLDAARRSLGWRRWDPTLLMRPKLRKIFKRY